MAHRYRITTPSKPAGLWNPDRQLTAAIAERDQFLERHPQYRELQQEIDRMLDKAGSAENRMAVLALLMESKLIELHGNLQRLNRILLSAQDR
ncbi:MAG: hypothetical protein C4519_10280 [Desulfobacteraceae bacterium]|nr:MAG: hypothetical protein C4519_10280 [Desulfobacteraceae bacterium]